MTINSASYTLIEKKLVCVISHIVVLVYERGFCY